MRSIGTTVYATRVALERMLDTFILILYDACLWAPLPRLPAVEMPADRVLVSVSAQSGVQEGFQHL